jgi:hypothetical protein
VTDSSTSGKTPVPLLDDEDEVGGCGLAVATGATTWTKSSYTSSILLKVFEKKENKWLLEKCCELSWQKEHHAFSRKQHHN